MQYYTPSIPAIERPLLVPNDTPTLICPSCGDTMKHVRTIPKLSAVGTVHLRLPFVRRNRFKGSS
jgi:hypothetical protein